MIAILSIIIGGQWCSASSHTGPPLVSSIVIHGNHTIPSYKLLEAIPIKIHLDYTPSRLQGSLQVIVDMYRQQGFLLAEATANTVHWSNDSSTVDIAVNVAEGKRVIIGSIGFEGNTAFDTDRLTLEMELRVGGLLDEATLADDLDHIVGLYERNGYPFASAEVARAQIDTSDTEDRISLTIAIVEGEKVTVRELQVAGAKTTKDWVIFRESGIRVGDLYDYAKISKVPRRLARLNLFSSVAEPDLFVTPRGGDILITVQEGNPNTFDGIVGYVPAPSGGESGYVTGQVDVAMRNLFGTGRRFQVHWLREDRFSQELGFRYLEPWVAGFPIDLSGAFQQRQQDTTYVRRGYDIAGTLRLGDIVSIGGSVSTASVIPSTSLTGRQLSSSATLTTNADLQIDSRDDPVAPTSGIFYHTQYGIGKKDAEGGLLSGAASSTTVQTLGIDVQGYLEVLTRQVAMLGLHGREISNDHLETADLFRFGGASTLRGYRENQFSGSRIVWTNAEYRFLLSKRSFFFGFFDTGYFFLPENVGGSSAALQDFKYGYGVGLWIDTNLGILGVSFGLGRGDPFSQAKIHIGIINDF